MYDDKKKTTILWDRSVGNLVAVAAVAADTLSFVYEWVRCSALIQSLPRRICVHVIIITSRKILITKIIYSRSLLRVASAADNLSFFRGRCQISSYWRSKYISILMYMNIVCVSLCTIRGAILLASPLPSRQLCVSAKRWKPPSILSPTAYVG